MSVVPSSTLPKCTRTAVIDLLFMRKYQLTQTQMLVMYYLLMLKNWAKYRKGDYCVILSKKIEKDLGLHQKTVEASITVLKKLSLIHTIRCEIKDWSLTRTYRAIAISSLGKEYNLSYYKEDEYQNSVELEKENEIYRVENDKVHTQNMELESKNSTLELQNRMLNLQIEGDETVQKASVEVLEKFEALKMENKALKERIEMQENRENSSSQKIEEDIDTFRKKTIKEYAESGKALCNAVKNNDNWLIDTNFYINSYSRLSIYLPNGESKQIAEPKKIENFWKWLFYHQHRVGKLVKTKQKANISTLIPLKGSVITMNQISYKIHDLEAVVGGVKVTLLASNGKLVRMGNSYGSDIIDVLKFEKFCRV